MSQPGQAPETTTPLTPWPQRFSRWLAMAQQLAEQPPELELAEPEDRDQTTLGLAQSFTAMRQELRQQSKETRRLAQEARQMIDAAEEDDQQTLRPILEALCNQEESMSLAVEQARALQERMAQAAQPSTANAQPPPGPTVQAMVEAHERAFAALSPWRRWAARGYHQEMLERLADALDQGEAEAEAETEAAADDPTHEPAQAQTQAPATPAEEAAGLAEGLSMIHQRLRTLLAEQGVHRLSCAGQPVDPHRMIVLEQAFDPQTPPGHVAHEVRPGYAWGDRVLRLAQVAARPSPAGARQGET